MTVFGRLFPKKYRATARYVAIAFVFVLSQVVSGSGQTSGPTYTVLYNFGSPSNTGDGAYPDAGLAVDGAGNLYGTTLMGGAAGFGTVFRLDSAFNEKVLYSFGSVREDGVFSDGEYPKAGVIRDAGGSLYGTNSEGGVYDQGTLYKLDSANHYTVLYNFCSGVGANGENCVDGIGPRAGVIQDQDARGILYGTTEYGGTASDAGTIFKWDNTTKTETVLYSFCSVGGNECTDGAAPQAGLIQDAEGNLYGTTALAGGSGTGLGGTIFKWDKNAQTLTVLYSFCSSPNCTDGRTPEAGLILDPAGNLYGTTRGGGTNGAGTVFKWDSSTRTETVLYNFCSAPNCADGGYPEAGLVQDFAGNLYGTTTGGGGDGQGAAGNGTIFRLDTGGHFTVLHSFCPTLNCTDGVGPTGLIKDAAGNLYGTTYAGGANGVGVVFRLSGATVIPPALQFIPITPCRVVDTRSASGPFGGPELAAASTREFDIPKSSCNIPSTAVAYSLNATVVPNASLNYLTLWPSGQTQPNVSTLNSDGRVKANAAITSAGTNGAVSVFASDATQFILDIDGYFVPAGTSSALAFYPVKPCRIADTRNTNGSLGGPSLGARASRSFPILSSSCDVPSSAQAYSLNVTAIPHSTLNYLTTWPTGEAQPNASTLNSSTGTVAANAAIVPAGTNGDVSIFVSDPADVILDVNGYFAPPVAGSGLSLYPMPPCRVIDTRPSSFNGTLALLIQDSSCAPPSTAQAYVLNSTVVPSGQLIYLSLYPDGSALPNVSTLNADDGAITSNMAIVPTSNGSVDAFADGTTQLILDISSYFAP